MHYWAVRHNKHCLKRLIPRTLPGLLTQHDESYSRSIKKFCRTSSSFSYSRSIKKFCRTSSSFFRYSESCTNHCTIIARLSNHYQGEKNHFFPPLITIINTPCHQGVNIPPIQEPIQDSLELLQL